MYIYIYIYVNENSKVKIKDGVLMLYTTSFADVVFNCVQSLPFYFRLLS